MRHYGMEPTLKDSEVGFIFGAEESDASQIVKVGRLTEYGPSHDVFMDISLEKVIAICGKRGQGKSYTLGSFIEGLVTQHLSTSVSRLTDRRAVLLFDTLDIFQWMGVPLTSELRARYPEIERQAKALDGWCMSPEPLQVEVWRPAGYPSLSDRGSHREFRLRVSDFGIEDWGLLLGLDTVRDIKGQLLADAYVKVTSLGWNHRDGRWIDSIPEYSIDDLQDCLDNDPDFAGGQIYHSETVRAVRQQLLAFSRLSLFQGTGTPLNELLHAGQASVLLLNRLPEDLRGVLVAVIVRRLLRERAAASEAAKNLLVNPHLAERDAVALRELVRTAVPKTWVVIDEAQNVIPSDRKTSASEGLVKLVKEGRNFGLSFIVTTQQPKALDRSVMSQVETFVIHKLVSLADIDYVLENTKCPFPDRIKEDIRTLSPRELLLDLQCGQVVVSDANTVRAFAMQVRPRISVHGGFEA